MHTDARTLPDGSLIQGDLCIIGAGAAGLSLAREWLGRRETVVLLEGGGFELETAMQALYGAQIIGETYFPLEAARLHYFGGTTNHWAGFCSVMDPHDFDVRPWVPYSGWPISYDDVEPAYRRAHDVLDLGAFEYDVAAIAAQHPDNQVLPFRPDLLRTKIWRFSRPTRMGPKYRDAVLSSDNVHLVTHANVTQIEVNEAATAATGLRAATLEGKTHEVRARTYVLACGAIQNARLLLASNERVASGLGNDRDLVGRYFMEHLEMPGARLILTAPRPMRLYEFHFPETKYPSGEIALSPAAQRENEVLNGVCSFREAPANDEPLQGMFGQIPPDAVERLRDVEEMDRAAAAPADSEPARAYPLEYQLFSRAEQSPNPNSRVTIGAERDALGVPRARLDWRLTDLDKRSMRRFYEVLGREAGRSGVARIQLHDWLMEEGWPPFLGGGWHHMGTTRMADDPADGVVDADSRIHGMENLYVAGSGTFPTGSCVNPTLSLVALTIRLSDHLKNNIR